MRRMVKDYTERFLPHCHDRQQLEQQRLRPGPRDRPVETAGAPALEPGCRPGDRARPAANHRRPGGHHRRQGLVQRPLRRRLGRRGRQRRAQPAGRDCRPADSTMQHSGWDNGAAVYQCSLKPDTSGHIVLGVHARPSKPTLVNPNELGIAAWAKLTPTATSRGRRANASVRQRAPGHFASLPRHLLQMRPLVQLE